MYNVVNAYEEGLSTRRPGEKLNDFNYLVIGNTGSGKSILQESITSSYYRHGYTIINIRDAKDNLEGAFPLFKPTAKYHIKQLERNNHLQLTRTYPLKIYHPLIKINIPNKAIPPINFFTIDLRSLSSDEVAFILDEETELPSTTATLLINSINQLKPEEGYYKLLHRAFGAIGRKQKMVGAKKITKADPNRAYLPIAGGDITNIDKIYSLLYRFEKYFCFGPHNYAYNLNIVDIMNDNENYHVFTTKYFDKNDEKQKDFFAYWLMNQIFKNLHKAKHPIMLVWDEIRIICPKTPKGYKKLIANLASKVMSLSRIKRLSTISTTQVFTDLDDGVLSSYNRVLIGRTQSGADIDAIQSKYKLERHAVQVLTRIDTGKFLYIGNVNRGLSDVKFPLHAHCEPGDVFEELYERYYNDKMVNYNFLLKEIRRLQAEELEEIRKVVQQREFEEEDQAKKEIQAKIEQEKKKEAKEEIKKEKKIVEKVDKEQRSKIIIQTWDGERLRGEWPSMKELRRLIHEKYNMDISVAIIQKILKPIRDKENG